MTKRLIKAVPQPEDMTIAEMDDDELMAYAEKLVDGGLFSNVPGLSSEAPATPEESEI